MKTFKTVLLIIIVLIIIVLLVALFLPAEYNVARSIGINKPVEVVFAQVSGFQNRGEWDPWLKQEPTAEVTHSDPDSGVGATYAWEGEKIGAGKMKIEEIVANKSVKSTLEFLEPQPMKALVSWQLEPTDSGTRAIWTISGKLNYPVGRFMGLFMDSMIGADFEQGLANLKKFIEER